VVLTVTTIFMVTTSGRMVPAMALVAASSAPAYRGSFMSFNSAVQQISAGVATSVAGFLLEERADHVLVGFPLVGLLACVVTLSSMVLAGRLRKDPGGELAPDSLPAEDLSPVPEIVLEANAALEAIPVREDRVA
jgi:predicted MFS family arabinose efflux permease